MKHGAKVSEEYLGELKNKIKKIDFEDPKILQIGFNKTATTYMAENFYKSKIYLKVLEGTYFASAKFFASYICFTEEEFYSEETAKLLYQNITIEAGFMPEAYIDETFTFRYYILFDQERVIKRLYSIFKNAIIVLGTRKLSEWIISHWGQYIRSGGLLNINDFINLLLEREDSELIMANFSKLKYILNKIAPERHLIYNISEVKDLDNLSKILSEKLEIPQTFPKKSSKKMQVAKIKESNISDGILSLKIQRFVNHLIRHDTGASPYSLTNWDKVIIKNSSKKFIDREHKGFFLRNRFKGYKSRIFQKLISIFYKDKLTDIKIQKFLIEKINKTEKTWEICYTNDKSFK